MHQNNSRRINSLTSLSVNGCARMCIVDIPCSLEISGLYQNLDVSWTNFTVTCLSVVFSVKQKGNKMVKTLLKHKSIFYSYKFQSPSLFKPPVIRRTI